MTSQLPTGTKIDKRIFQYSANESDDDYTRRYVDARIRRLGTPQSLRVSKFIQYDVLAPPNNALSISKFVQFVALVPPDNALMASKFVQFIVLEAPTPLPTRNTQRNFAQFFQNKPKAKSKSIGTTPLGRRIYVFTIT